MGWGWGQNDLFFGRREKNPSTSDFDWYRCKTIFLGEKRSFDSVNKPNMFWRHLELVLLLPLTLLRPF